MKIIEIECCIDCPYVKLEHNEYKYWWFECAKSYDDDSPIQSRWEGVTAMQALNTLFKKCPLKDIEETIIDIPCGKVD